MRLWRNSHPHVPLNVSLRHPQSSIQNLWQLEPAACHQMLLMLCRLSHACESTCCVIRVKVPSLSECHGAHHTVMRRLSWTFVRAVICWLVKDHRTWSFFFYDTEVYQVLYCCNAVREWSSGLWVIMYTDKKTWVDFMTFRFFLLLFFVFCFLFLFCFSFLLLSFWCGPT